VRLEEGRGRIGHPAGFRKAWASAGRATVPQEKRALV
jgi:hypothetical protein